LTLYAESAERVAIDSAHSDELLDLASDQAFRERPQPGEHFGVDGLSRVRKRGLDAAVDLGLDVAVRAVLEVSGYAACGLDIDFTVEITLNGLENFLA